MEIKTLTPAQLQQFIATDEFKHMPVIPISTIRAQSHIANPRASADDVIMILAYEGKEMLGYLGVFADRIFAANAASGLRCGWLSCMWVNPKMRGKGIAKQLINTAFDAWNDHILVTEFTPEAKALYDSTGHFSDLQVKQGLRAFLRFNLHEVLPKKSARWQQLKPLLAVADAIANVPNDLRLRFANQADDEPDMATDFLEDVSEETAAFIDNFQQRELFRRNFAELNWMLNHPWLSESKTATRESRRYHFSSIAKQFLFAPFNMRNGNELRAHITFSLRNNHQRMPYAFFRDSETEEVVKLIYWMLFEERANMLSVYEPRIVQWLQTHRTPFIHTRPISRPYIITKTLAQQLGDLSTLCIQDGDGDAAFT